VLHTNPWHCGFFSRSSNRTVSFVTYQNLGREATMSTGQADLNMLKVTVVEVGIVMVFVCLVIISLSL